MKQLFVGLLVLFIHTLKAQNMETPQQCVIDLFVATDQQNWDALSNLFDTEVLLDYSSMSQQPASTLTPTQIIDAWKKLLPGFEHTHHQVSNFQSEVTNNHAKVACYGTARHFLKDPEGSVWTVVGSYRFELRKNTDNQWVITHMKFLYKFEEGNSKLPQKAMKNV